ncbi:MAG: DUF1801 domain-containing protein [Candidatus Kapabacteria bacterium]|jgi:hypothetical protein|nr:DUF1801 domain-containing protein [Candidatus Kapabacteria bacterium]
MAAADFESINARLRSIIAPYVEGLTPKINTPKHVEYYKVGPVNIGGKAKDEVFVFGVRVGKSYVSFYVFPLYTHPDEVPVPNSLVPRRQGKNCFNFTKSIDAIQFRDLNILVKQAWEVYRTHGIL